jgi:phospholipid/cholesterol/gamma-HCH transport system substrate-binding protein
MNKKVIDTLVGLFLLAAVLLGVLALVSRTTLRALFTRSVIAETWLPRAIVTEGSAIYFRGYRIGSVLGTEPRFFNTNPGEDWFRVELAIDPEFAGEITDQFVTTVESGPLGNITGANLLLLAPGEEGSGVPGPVTRAGTPLADLPKGQRVVLHYNNPVSMLDSLKAQVDELMPFIKEAIKSGTKLIEQLADPKGDLMLAVAELRRAAEDLNKDEGPLRRSLNQLLDLTEKLNRDDGPVLGALHKVDSVVAHLDGILAGLERGEGIAGGLLKDPKMKDELLGTMTELKGIAEQTRKLLEEAHPTLGNVERTTAELPVLMKKIGSILDRLDTASQDLPGIAQEVQALLIETDSTLRAIQKLPFVRDHVADPDTAAPTVLPASGGGGS